MKTLACNWGAIHQPHQWGAPAHLPQPFNCPGRSDTTVGDVLPADGADQPELAPAAVAQTDPVAELHRGLDLRAAVEAAEREVPCLKGGGPHVLGVSVVNVPNRAETAVNVIVPHVLRAAAQALVDTDEHDERCGLGPAGTCECYLGKHVRWLRALAEESAGGGR